MKQQIGLMRDTLSAKDDEILTQTQMKIASLEQRMGGLNAVVEKLSTLEQRLSGMGEKGELLDRLAAVKTGMPDFSAKPTVA